MWTESGPSEAAIAIMEANGGPLSSGERVVILAAWAFWNGHDGVSFADVVERLDSPNLRAIGGLMTALSSGGAAVDAWLAGVERELGREGLR
jgi:hypothetical protein